jgi:hypothetical protein
LWRLPVVESYKPIISLAPQLQHKTGTITFSSEKLKKQGLGYGGVGPFSIDDTFNGITVLYSASDPEIEYVKRFHTHIQRFCFWLTLLQSICAIHGLNGNAFDTWAYDHKIMWLRDFLPEDEHFKQSRVMTFGYSSLLRDSRNMSNLTEWSQGLLLSISSLRKSQAVRKCTVTRIWWQHY